MKRLILVWLAITGAVALMSCGGGGGGGSSAVAPRESASITITGLPTGAAVYIDGQKAEAVDGKYAVQAGTRAVEARRAGYEMADGPIEVTVEAGEDKEVAVNLTVRTPPGLPGGAPRAAE